MADLQQQLQDAQEQLQVYQRNAAGVGVENARLQVSVHTLLPCVEKELGKETVASERVSNNAVLSAQSTCTGQ